MWISNPNNSNANGTFSFNSDRAFNAADPSTYPERFSIRVPGPLDYELTIECVGAVRAGQVGDDERPHAEPRHPL